MDGQVAFMTTPAVRLAPSSLRKDICALGGTSFVTGHPKRMMGADGTTGPQGQKKARRCQIQCSEMGVSFPTKSYDEDFRIGVISTRWNENLVKKLQADVKETLLSNSLSEENIVQMEVPGAFELPIAARLMCAAQKVDAVVCIGVLIKGETDHYDLIASAVSSGLMDLQLTLSIPMIFGVLCCPDTKTAEERSIGDKSHAVGWAKTAIEMANLKKSQLGGVSAGKKSVGFF